MQLSEVYIFSHLSDAISVCKAEKANIQFPMFRHGRGQS